MFDSKFLIISNWIRKKKSIKLLSEIDIQNISIKRVKSKAEPGYLGLFIPYSKLTIYSIKIKLIQHRKKHFLHKSYSDIQDVGRMFNKFNITTGFLFFLRRRKRKTDWLNSHLLLCRRPAKEHIPPPRPSCHCDWLNIFWLSPVMRIQIPFMCIMD